MNLFDVAKLYDQRMIAYGKVAKSAGWSSEAQQALRFKILCEMIDLNQATSVLDVGCGYASLLKYIKNYIHAYDETQYTGVDLSNEMIRVCKVDWPESNFYLGDGVRSNVAGRNFDWVLCSGALNFELESVDKYEYLEMFISTYFSSVDQGVAFNLISSNVDYKDEKLAYYDPDKVLKILMKYSKYYSIVANYPLWEFSCVVQKIQNID